MTKQFGRFGLVVAGALVALALAGVSAASGLNAVSNGDFETGSLASWTTFTTANGTINGGDVQMFDTTGNGASYAAHFNVGEVNFTGLYEGGGISQNFFGSGSYKVSADIAAVSPNHDNGDCGDFELMVDGHTVSSYDFGQCYLGVPVRSHLEGTVQLRLGWHQLAVRITRPYTTLAGNETPQQYVDNVSLVRKLSRV
jgi:hypothetical protein